MHEKFVANRTGGDIENFLGYGKGRVDIQVSLR